MQSNVESNDKSLGAARAAAIGLIVFAFLFCVCGLSDISRREGRNAVGAREMISSGNYLIPTLGGQPRFEKPPMMYWAIAGSANLFNGGRVNEWVAALPSAAAGAVTCVMIAVVGTVFFGRSTGILASAILATCYGFYKWGQNAQLEMLLTSMVVCSVGSFIMWNREPRNSRWLFMCYAFAAFACMTKGPVALVFIVTATLSCALCCKLAGQPTCHFGTRWHALGLAIFFVIALPWPAIMMTHPEAKEAFDREVLGRFGGSWNRHMGGPLYYVASFPTLTAPWILGLPLIVWRFWSERSRLRSEHNAALFLALWATISFIFFSCLQTKQVYYILPIVPAFALLVAWAIQTVPRGVRIAQILAGATAMMFLIYFGVVVPRGDAKLGPKAFANEVRQLAGSPKDLAYYFLHEEGSFTVDLRADIYYYLGPKVRLLADSRKNPPKNAAEFAKKIANCSYVVLSAKDCTEEWVNEIPGLKVAKRLSVDKAEYVVLARTDSAKTQPVVNAK